MKQIKNPKSSIKLVKLAVVFGISIVGGIALYILLNRQGFLMPVSELRSVLCLDSCTPEPPIHPLLSNKRPLQNRNRVRDCSEIKCNFISENR
jgi:hypothetical protein